jgi:hypothetical protein
MTDVIACPACHRRLLLPLALRGESVQCPGCGKTFNAGQGRPPPPSAREQEAPPRGWGWKDEERRLPRAEEETADRRHPHGRAREARPPVRHGRSAAPPRVWHHVRSGIDLVLAAIIVLLATVLLVGCGVFTLLTDGGRPGEAVGVLVSLLVLVWLGTEVLTLIGFALCQAAPPANGARSLATSALILGVIGLLLNVVNGVMLLNGGGPFGGPRRGGDTVALASLLNLVATVVHVARTYTFLFFLRAVAWLRGADGVVRGLNGLMVLVGVAVVGYLFLAFAVATSRPGFAGRRGLGEPAAAVVGCGCIELVLVVVGVIWYIGMLVATRQAVDVPGA